MKTAIDTGQDSPLQAAKEKLSIPVLWAIFNFPGKPAKSCRSPFREDRNPSFLVNGDRWWDFATGEGGDQADFVARACNLSPEEGCRKLIEMAGVLPHPNERANPGNFIRLTRDDDAEREAKRAGWPEFDEPTQKEIKAIAKLRGLSVEGVFLATERGLLFCADFQEGRAWIITDSRRRNAQARRLDGQWWERLGAKAWTLPGSEAAWPIGLHEVSSFPAIALVEGGPDLLGAFHLIWCAGVESEVAPVAILGGSNTLRENALRYFAGKRVRIFQHDDEPGRNAGALWAAQLTAAGAEVDGYSFGGLKRTDGDAVKDLNDFAHVHPDLWEEQREIIEEAFSFALEGPPRVSKHGDRAVQTAA